MTTTEPRTPGTTRPGLVLLVVSAAVFLAALDLFIVNVAFPELSRSLDASTSALSWVLNGYTITFAALLAPAGRIADRIGRRRVFLAGLVTFSLGSLGCALTVVGGLVAVAAPIRGAVVAGIGGLSVLVDQP